MKAILIADHQMPGKSEIGKFKFGQIAESLQPNELKLDPTDFFTVTHSRVIIQATIKRKWIQKRFKALYNRMAKQDNLPEAVKLSTNLETANGLGLGEGQK